jgi:hypothetical protein
LFHGDGRLVACIIFGLSRAGGMLEQQSQTGGERPKIYDSLLARQKMAIFPGRHLANR